MKVEAGKFYLTDKGRYVGPMERTKIGSTPVWTYPGNERRIRWKKHGKCCFVFMSDFGEDLVCSQETWASLLAILAEQVRTTR